MREAEEAAAAAQEAASARERRPCAAGTRARARRPEARDGALKQRSLAAIAMQAGFRGGQEVRQVQLARDAAATTIQSGYRAYAARVMAARLEWEEQQAARAEMIAKILACRAEGAADRGARPDASASARALLQARARRAQARARRAMADYGEAPWLDAGFSAVAAGWGDARATQPRRRRRSGRRRAACPVVSCCACRGRRRRRWRHPRLRRRRRAAARATARRRTCRRRREARRPRVRHHARAAAAIDARARPARRRALAASRRAPAAILALGAPERACHARAFQRLEAGVAPPASVIRRRDAHEG